MSEEPLSKPLESRGFRPIETALPGDWATNVRMSIQITSKREGVGRMSDMEPRERCPNCNELLDHADSEYLEEWCIQPECDYYRAE